MKTVGQLMEELGFNKDSPDSVKKAFIKHLVAAANEASPRTPLAVAYSEASLKADSNSEQKAKTSGSKMSPSSKPAMEQLSFQFEPVLPDGKKNEAS